jgi:F-type H+-transporting ATPase subunit b
MNQQTSRALLTLLLLASIIFFVPASAAQEHQPAAPASQPTATEHPDNKGEVPAHAAGTAEGEHGAPKSEGGGKSLHETEQEMKMSASVKALGKMLGIENPKTAYWVFWIVNFSVIAFLILSLLGKKLPGAFRNRTSAIQRGIDEARKASAEASARLTAIEARLSALDSEITSMRASAEQEGKAEENRLRAATEEEKRSILESAEQEINAATNVARRDLRNYATELAVELAQKRIAVSESADRALIQEFSKNLGNGGRS